MELVPEVSETIFDKKQMIRVMFMTEDGGSGYAITFDAAKSLRNQLSYLLENDGVCSVCKHEPEHHSGHEGMWCDLCPEGACQ